MSATVLFVLNGVLVGVLMLNHNTITYDDGVKLVFFFFFIFLTRTIMVLLFFPFLKQFGAELTTKEVIVFIYSGLRGPLGIALSIFVFVDGGLRVRFRELTIFYVCGIAMMAQVINVLTIGKVV